MSCPTCGATVAASVAICPVCGDTIAQARQGAPSVALPVGISLAGGRYVVEAVLGEGGFGITYRARETALQRRVAIKEFFVDQLCHRSGKTVVLDPNRAKDLLEWRRRFLTEAQVMARFTQPLIAPVYSFFEENNTAYIVMELVGGTTLESVLATRGKIPEREAVDWILKAAQGVALVHRAHFLHLDIKPANLLLTKSGQIILIDFGCASPFAPGQVTQGPPAFTPGYASPEQEIRGAVSPSSDVYSLGATLYHLLTGSVPTASSDRKRGLALPAADVIVPTLSPSLNRALHRSMALDDSTRQHCINELVTALRSPFIPFEREFRSIFGQPPPSPAACASAGVLALAATVCLLTGPISHPAEARVPGALLVSQELTAPTELPPSSAAQSPDSDDGRQRLTRAIVRNRKAIRRARELLAKK